MCAVLFFKFIVLCRICTSRSVRYYINICIYSACNILLLSGNFFSYYYSYEVTHTRVVMMMMTTEIEYSRRGGGGGGGLITGSRIGGANRRLSPGCRRRISREPLISAYNIIMHITIILYLILYYIYGARADDNNDGVSKTRNLHLILSAMYNRLMPANIGEYGRNIRHTQGTDVDRGALCKARGV